MSKTRPHLARLVKKIARKKVIATATWRNSGNLIKEKNEDTLLPWCTWRIIIPRPDPWVPWDPTSMPTPGRDYTGLPATRWTTPRLELSTGEPPAPTTGMPPMMAHPGLDYDFTRLDIYGRAKQGRAKGNGRCPLHVDLSASLWFTSICM